jgi:phosphotransferase system HPr (HPr) family protein
LHASDVIIVNRDGLHLRVAGAIAKIVRQYDAKVLLSCNGCKFVDGGSVIQLLVLGASGGASVVVQAEGPDERAAVRAVSEILENGAGI